ncbi:hypothetical protein Q8A73_016209 [Channa argus]|nr:hypothetical protein Q8A73_016209 [Channa argus]
MDEAEAGRERGSGGGKYRVILRERKRMGGQVGLLCIPFYPALTVTTFNPIIHSPWRHWQHMEIDEELEQKHKRRQGQVKKYSSCSDSVLRGHCGGEGIRGIPLKPRYEKRSPTCTLDITLSLCASEGNGEGVGVCECVYVRSSGFLFKCSWDWFH